MTGNSSFLRASFQTTDAQSLIKLSSTLGICALTVALMATPAASETPSSVDLDLSAIGLRTGADDRIAPGRAPVVLRYPGSAPKARILLTPPPSAQPPIIGASTAGTPTAPIVLAPAGSTPATLDATPPPRLVTAPVLARPPAAPTRTAAFPNANDISPAPLLPVTRAPVRPTPTATPPAPTPAANRQASLRTPNAGASSLPPPATASHRLRFDAGVATFLSQTRNKLDLIAAELMRHSDRIEIQAYAGAPSDLSSPARRLSLKRGLAVRKYLVEQGVLRNRIDVRALGGVRDSGPGERVDIVLSNR